MVHILIDIGRDLNTVCQTRATSSQKSPFYNFLLTSLPSGCHGGDRAVQPCLAGDRRCN